MSATERRRVRVGLIGTGIGGSLSPAMHEAEGAANGLDYSYERFDLAGAADPDAALKAALDEAEGRGFAGVNVTHPFKQAVIDHLHALSPEAQALGAVNTVVFGHGRRTGHNTDCTGFARGFSGQLSDAALHEVVQLGAGGAGLAVAHALLTLGTERLTLVDRQPTRSAAAGRALAERFGKSRIQVADDPAEALATADGLVNATPVGMAAYPGIPLRPELLRPSLWVADVVYVPLDTELLQAARAMGCRVCDGGGMAVFQAVEAFELFTAIAPDSRRMQAHFAELTGNVPAT